ncbi:Mor transcription activator family protein [Burkholderia sp. MSMB1589WGS]|uniref:Mor transcription activator family protein n=1 Tax=Burkholderia sp. MSMB1589WGS TaxID=1636425 RepID=UPI0022B22F85|nr:Mor transcription activator family protein [Burkholderia sp. MSMB1589WGS]
MRKNGPYHPLRIQQRHIYFQMGASYRLSQRDRQIFDEFRGDKHGDLARKYGVSLQWV